MLRESLRLAAGSMHYIHKQQRQPTVAVSPFMIACHSANLDPGDPRDHALLSSVDERAEHGLDHGFDGRIIDALGLRQLGRDGFEVAIACRWRQRHRSLAHDRELTVGQAQDVISFCEIHRSVT